ncbi:LAETG motif-containing sortase-dependent surface protein [Streptomyces sp. DH24]|uniref:LAETG motif-containing sortase-dependent surface protein n=1 Tax=Streptomyces sp. DH24 TaxID=3040123 RepID=UPI002440FC09|nr:LAETG motif-containing sortase-dependent surface protein [Streptomyces sp. DH24]MDG9717035.1 LAETG motif-containing sortase-dependent surface protein [Streptomyces sp. DH24]
MNMIRRPAAVAVTALALAALPSVAAAHEGSHPFKNCAEAYENGYANIREGDEHYGTHLDRDADGIGCDKPPADFVPADDEDTADDGGAADETGSTGGSESSGEGTDLAETGGSGATPYLAAGSVVVLLAGAGLMTATRRRRAEG